MNRRNTLLALGGAAAIPTMLRFGSSASAASLDESYLTQTLQYGTLSLETSRYARAHVTTKNLHEFAIGESLEAVSIAQSLTGLAKPPPAQLTREQQAILDQVRSATGTALDTLYNDVQIKGHEALLKLQDAFIGSNPDYKSDAVHIALIFRAFIHNHLYILRQLKSGGLPPN